MWYIASKLFHEVRKMLKTKGCWFAREIIIQSIYMKLRFTLSYRDVEELLKDRGISVDHATIQRWVVKFTPYLEKKFFNKKRKVGKSWRMDETSMKIKGKWYWYYRAVDKEGDIIDFFLSERRNTTAAKRFLIKAINRNGKPIKINIDKSGANTAGIKRYKKQYNRRIEIRQCKYLNNIVEQSHRFIKKKVRPMLGFKSFESAGVTLAGFEVVRMLQKRQQRYAKNSSKSVPEMFRLLAA